MRIGGTWAQAAFLTAATALGGLAVRDPAFAAAGWVSVAALAWGLARWRASAAGTLGLVVGGGISLWVALPWAWGVYAVAGGPGWAWVAALPTTAVWAALSRAPVAIAWRWLGARLPVWLWLPPAWLLGEAWLEAAAGLMIDAWLYGQWQVAPVLNALALLGWWPTLLACLMLASAVGAVAAGSRRAIAVAAGLALVGAALPARTPQPAAALEGVGVVHMASLAAAPREAPPGLGLLVWPEQVAAGRPPLSEGVADGRRRLPTPIMRPGLHHLYGAAARTPEGTMNAIAGLAPGGRVVAMRGKRRLFPMVERPFLGLMAPGRTPYHPGRAPAWLEVGPYRAGALVCLESFDRALFTEAEAAGARFVAISANDELLGGDPAGDRQMLGLAVLRAVETGLPVARASVHGRASLVAADGRVLAWSEPGATGVLSLPKGR